MFKYLRPIQASIFLVMLLLFSCTTIEIRESDAFDNHKTITPESFNYENIELTTHLVDTPDGESLHLWHIKKSNDLPTVVYFGGNGFLLVKSRILIDAFENISANLILFDYRGYGESTGSPSVDGLFTDSQTIIDFAEDKGIKDLVFYGHSMGSFVATEMALSNNPIGLILEGPITNLENWTSGLVPVLLRPFIRFRFDDELSNQNNVERIRKWDDPLLILAGSQDEITPKRMAKKLYDESPSSKKKLNIVKGGSHNDLPLFDSFIHSITEFMSTLNPNYSRKHEI